MRTTLVLEDDVAVRIEALRERRKGGLKDIVNQLLRAALDRAEADREPPRARFVQRTYRVEPRLHDFDNVAEVIAAVDGDDWR